MIIPSVPASDSALIRQVTTIETPVSGVPAFGESVTVMLSAPPWSPGLGPPNESKLTNDVAFQVPRLTTAPPLARIVNEPLPTHVPGALGPKPPPPCTRVASPAP